ncbi:hypothetical protein [Amycolatopsis sp. cmx-11-51]
MRSAPSTAAKTRWWAGRLGDDLVVAHFHQHVFARHRGTPEEIG